MDLVKNNVVEYVAQFIGWLLFLSMDLSL